MQWQKRNVNFSNAYSELGFQVYKLCLQVQLLSFKLRCNILALLPEHPLTMQCGLHLGHISCVSARKLPRAVHCGKSVQAVLSHRALVITATPIPFWAVNAVNRMICKSKVKCEQSNGQSLGVKLLSDMADHESMMEQVLNQCKCKSEQGCLGCLYANEQTIPTCTELKTAAIWVVSIEDSRHTRWPTKAKMLANC